MPFYVSESETVDAEMMIQLGRFAYGYEDLVDILVMPYKGEQLSMTILLPREIEGLSRIEGTLTVDDLALWSNDLYTGAVEVYLPRFRIEPEESFDLVNHGDLRALGITDALDAEKADFSGIALPRNWLFIRRFVHKVFIEVNEEGTEAAAVTVGGCFPAGTPVLTPDGPRPIESIAAGDSVYAFDLARARWVTAAVTKLAPYPFSGDMITFHAGGKTIAATWNHPFLVVRGEKLNARRVPMDLPAGEPAATPHGRWVEARDLRPGDVLLARPGPAVTVTQVYSRQGRAEVFMLEIDGIHNHTAGELGILVHNGAGKQEGIPSFRANHPFLFFIRDTKTGNLLFMGRVGNPGGG